MSAIRLARAFFLVSSIILVAEDCLASAFVRGAYYRLGEDDPGAMAGSVGNDPTQDSFARRPRSTAVRFAEIFGRCATAGPLGEHAIDGVRQ